MTNLGEPASTSLTNDIVAWIRFHLSGRRGLTILLIPVAITGITLNWSWLVSSDVLPILITVLPCLVMCGLGLCMNRITGGSCDTKQQKIASPEKEVRHKDAGDE